MKFLCLLLLLFSVHVASATDDKNGKKLRLKNELIAAERIESCTYSHFCSKSIISYKADTLMSLSNLEEIITYGNDSSYTLKYYAFIELLGRDFTTAFTILKAHQNDSFLVYRHTQPDYPLEKFNHVLLDKFYFAASVYNRGGYISIDHLFHPFSEQEKKTWRQIKKELKLMYPEVKF